MMKTNMASSSHHPPSHYVYTLLKLLLILQIVCPFHTNIGSAAAALHSIKLHRKHSVKHAVDHDRSASSASHAHHHRKHSHRSYSDRIRGESAPYPSNSKIFDVLAFGARGDGSSDDTQAFLAAWQEACKEESAIFEVPAYFTFVIRPIVFSGPCASNMVFQVDGSIVAPNSLGKWGASKNLLQWINFSKLQNMVLQGAGLVDGMGALWWSACGSKGSKVSRSMIRPTAVRFYGSYNVTVKDLRIQNSPQTHLKFDSCIGVRVSNLTIFSPQDSPNTDGVHLQNTQDVEISHSLIENGDDCVSIQTGCSNLDIHNVDCEFGHGISVGGLGRGGTQACVSNVTVHDITIRHSQNGVRIKTWQGGSGSVRSISFTNVNVMNISNPIIIDQFYCDASKACKNQSSAVQVSGITYKNIRGTYMKSSPLHFACSNSFPCTQVTVAQVELLPQHGFFVDEPFCWNIYGYSQMPTIPPIQCLQNGLPPSPKGLKQSSFNDAC